MENTIICGFGSIKKEISPISKVGIRLATDIEKRRFAESYWSFPKELTCQVVLWKSFCSMLNELEKHPSWRDVEASAIWKMCLEAINKKYKGSIDTCSFELQPVIEHNTTRYIIQVECTSSVHHSTTYTDEFGLSCDASYTETYNNSFQCMFPLDFCMMLEAVEQYIAREIKLKCKKLSELTEGLDLVIVKQAETKLQKKKKENCVKLLKLIYAHKHSLQFVNDYMSKSKIILGQKNYKQFTETKQRVLYVDDELFFEFENSCGFDLDSKLVHIQDTIEKSKMLAARNARERRAQAAAKLEQHKLNMARQVEQLFEKERLLKAVALSTFDKYSEYERVRNICISFIPELANYDSRSSDAFNEKMLPYLRIVPMHKYELFIQNWKKLNEAYFALRKGIKGEQKVADVLKLYNDQLCIIQNYRWEYEHDFIVITHSHIFTIEVKTLNGNYILTETGLLKRSDNPSNKGIDVVMQSKRHVISLRKKLKNCIAFGDRIPIQEIICSGEGDFTITNNFPDLPVCYYNTLDNHILPRGPQSRVLTNGEINEIRGYLLDHQEPPALFDLFKPQGELDSREQFIDSFSAVYAGFAWKDGEEFSRRS